MCKRRLDDTFNRIVSWARYDTPQMIDSSGQGGGSGPAQPVPQPPQPTPAPQRPQRQTPPRARRVVMSDAEKLERRRKQQRDWYHRKKAAQPADADASPHPVIAAAPAPAPALQAQVDPAKEEKRKRKNEKQKERDRAKKAARMLAAHPNPLLALVVAADAAPAGVADAASVDAHLPDPAGPADDTMLTD